MTATIQNERRFISEKEWVSPPNGRSTTATSFGGISPVVSAVGREHLLMMPAVAREVFLDPGVLTRVVSARETMEDLAALEGNWDSYGASRLRPEAVDQALLILARALSTRADLADPMIVPTSEGGLQLEWDHDRTHLEIEIRPTLEILVYWESPDGESWEGPMPKGPTGLDRLLEHIN